MGAILRLMGWGEFVVFGSYFGIGARDTLVASGEGRAGNDIGVRSGN